MISNFSFSHSVFNRVVLQTRKNQGLFGKGLRKGREYCGKRRKCWLPAFPPFLKMFSKGFSPRVVKSQDCVVKGLHYSAEEIPCYLVG